MGPRISDLAGGASGRRGALEKNRLVLDSGALSAVAEKSEQLRVAARQALAQSTEVVVPTVVIAESTTGHGGRDARVNHLLRAVVIAPLDEVLARQAARLRHATRSRRGGTIDAIVVATADRVPGSQLLTGDTRDIRHLAAVTNKTVVVSINALRPFSKT
jgi:predicted nucleic acid-binding protein